MKLYKRILVVFLAVIMLCGTALSGLSYSSSGNEGVANGDMTIVEGIFENLKEFGSDYIDGKIQDSIFDELGLPSVLPSPLSDVLDCVQLTADAYVDLYKAFLSWGKTKKEIMQQAMDLFETDYIYILGWIEYSYSLGAEHRGTNEKKPDLTTFNTRASNSLSILRRHLKEIKNDNIFIGDKNSRNKIQKLIDEVCNLQNTLPDFDYFYNLARYGSEYCSVVCNMKTNTKCRIISKSTGKYLNVYTDRAAEDLKNGDRIKVYKYAPDDTQEFCFVKNEQGAYRIRVNEGTKYLDVYNTVSDKIAKVGAKVQVWSKNNTHFRDQGFVFVYVDGYYRIHLAADTNYCLYVKSDGYVALGKVKENSSAQLWKIEYCD